MSYDLADTVIIPPEVLRLCTTKEGREMLDDVARCFDEFPGVLKLIGNLSGAAQPLTGDGQDIQINEGKRQLFLQVLSLISAAQIEPEKATKMLRGETDV